MGGGGGDKDTRELAQPPQNTDATKDREIKFTCISVDNVGLQIDVDCKHEHFMFMYCTRSEHCKHSQILEWNSTDLKYNITKMLT